MMNNYGMWILSVTVSSMMALSSSQYPAYEPLPSGQGQALVEDVFSRIPFWTGAWSNDASCLVPFQWRIEGKGVYTYFSAAEHKFFDGRAWQLWETGSGKLLPCKYDWSPDVDIWFTLGQLFEVEYNDGRRMLVFHNERRIGVDCPDRGEGLTSVSQKWYALSVATNGLPRKDLISEGVKTLFCSMQMKSIRCIIPHLYHGAKAEVRGEATPEQKQLLEAESNIGAWTLSRSQNGNLADLHQQYLSVMTTPSIAAKIFIVACDGNQDGIADAYVSSDAERDVHGDFKWTLYCGAKTGFYRAKNPSPVVLSQVEKLEIDPVVFAKRNAFFKLDRVGVKSYVMPITDGGELWNYARQASPVRRFRSKPGKQNISFYDCLMSCDGGIASLNDLFLIQPMLVSARRLPCETVVIQSKKSDK